MKIAIIGSGDIGSILARKLAACGHEITLANSRGAESIRQLARDVGASAASKEDAVQGVDVVILSIPFGKYPDLSNLLQHAPDPVVVIDTSNYYPVRDGAIPEVDSGKPESIWVSEKIGHPVIKAWNAVLAVTLAERGRSTEAPDRLAIPVAGDNARSKAIAMALVEDTGFDAIDAGSLDDSWRQQPGTPGYCTELDKKELAAALQSADRLRAPDDRDSLFQEFMTANPALTRAEIVSRCRAVTK